VQPIAQEDFPTPIRQGKLVKSGRNIAAYTVFLGKTAEWNREKPVRTGLHTGMKACNR
jgi:hypothetical protein